MRLTAVIFLLIGFTANGQMRNGSVLFARTSGRFAQLSYEVGEDGLGAAKLGYLDSAVLIKIIDSSRDMYHVQLSQSHKAYINKQDIRFDTAIIKRTTYLTGSFSVKGDEQYDYVNIALNEKLPYKSWTEVEPARIFLEIYGVKNNTNWITQLRSVKEIEEVYLSQPEDDVVRVTIQLKHRQHWGYTINYKNNALSFRIRRQPTSLKVNKLVIAIDAGHGGSDEGAVGAISKGFEKTYTLRFAKELEKYLKKKGATVLMTRTSDTTLNAIDRISVLQQAMPDLLVSLHFNASDNTNIRGVSTYYSQAGFRPLSTGLLNRLLQLDLSEFGNIANFGYTLNALTDFPNTTVEVAFLSNAEDEMKITDPRFQKSTAIKIYKGLRDWLKTAKE